MVQAGDIIRSSFFPEEIEVMRVEPIGEDFCLISAVGRSTNIYYEKLFERSDLQLLEPASLYSLREEGSTDHILQQLYFTLIEHALRYPKGRIFSNKHLMPLPHQIDAVYRRMLQAPRVRFLLADDPGAGKTIMAGMLIKELRARQSARRILILVPPLVLKQWQEELLEKFNEHFVIINRSLLEQYGIENPFSAHDSCIASMYWAARDDVRALVQESEFDLVIVDEAHKMAAYSHGIFKRKTHKTKLFQLGERLLRKAPQCVLLTATPHKGDVDNYRLLMSLIDPDIFSSPSVNASLREKSNPFVIRRLKEQLTNFDGTPLFPKRITKTIQFQLTEPELKLYEAVTSYVREHFNRSIDQGQHSKAFAMMLLQRRLSSSTEAIHQSLVRRKKKLEQLLEKTDQERKKVINKLQSKRQIAPTCQSDEGYDTLVYD